MYAPDSSTSSASWAEAAAKTAKSTKRDAHDILMALDILYTRATRRSGQNGFWRRTAGQTGGELNFLLLRVLGRQEMIELKQRWQ